MCRLQPPAPGTALSHDLLCSKPCPPHLGLPCCACCACCGLQPSVLEGLLELFYVGEDAGAGGDEEATKYMLS